MAPLTSSVTARHVLALALVLQRHWQQSSSSLPFGSPRQRALLPLRQLQRRTQLARRARFAVVQRISRTCVPRTDGVRAPCREERVRELTWRTPQDQHEARSQDVEAAPHRQAYDCACVESSWEERAALSELSPSAYVQGLRYRAGMDLRKCGESLDGARELTVSPCSPYSSLRLPSNRKSTRR